MEGFLFLLYEFLPQGSLYWGNSFTLGCGGMKEVTAELKPASWKLCALCIIKRFNNVSFNNIPQPKQTILSCFWWLLPFSWSLKFFKCKKVLLLDKTHFSLKKIKNNKKLQPIILPQINYTDHQKSTSSETEPFKSSSENFEPEYFISINRQTSLEVSYASLCQPREPQLCDHRNV